MRKMQQEFIKDFQLAQLNNKHKALIQEIYNSKDYKEISGEDVQTMCWSLNLETNVICADRKKINKF